MQSTDLHFGKGKTLESGLEKCIRLLFAMVMTWIMVSVLFLTGVSFSRKKEFSISNVWIAASAIVAIALFTVLSLILMKKLGKKSRRNRIPLEERMDSYVRRLTVILFLSEVYISLSIFEANTWDPAVLWSTATSLVDGNEIWADYFSTNPNNLFLLLFAVLMIRINRAVGVFSGNYGMMAVIIIDCVTLCAACYLTYKVLSNLTNKKAAGCGFLICVILAGLSPWMSVYYSDSTAILIPILSLYLYSKPYKNCKMKQLGCLVAVIVSAIGYSIKPHCAILLIAFFCMEVVYAIKTKSKGRLLRAAMVAGIAIISVTLNSALLIHQYESYGYKLDIEKERGMAHYFMMGLNQETGGTYSEEDCDLSAAQPTREARKEENIRVSKQRLSEMGFKGYLRHLNKKLLTAYHDGTFAWGMDGHSVGPVTEDLNLIMTPLLRSFYLTNGSRHELFKTIEQIIWISTLVFTWILALGVPVRSCSFEFGVIMLSLIGLTLFQLLFEVRARYLFLYIPFFCVAATLGAEYYIRNTQRFIKKWVR